MFDEDSIFGGLDVQSAKDDPWEIPEGMYDMSITEVKLVDGKGDNADKKYLTMKYTIDDGEQAGKSVTDRKWVPAKDDQSKEAADAASYLKLRMLQLGIPENRVNSVRKEDLVGIEVTAVVKKNGEYTNLSNKKDEFKLRQAPKPQEGGLAAFS